MVPKTFNYLLLFLLFAVTCLKAQDDPANGPHKLNNVSWDQYPQYLGANRAFMLTPINTATWTPTNKWGAYRPVVFDGPSGQFAGWNGTDWVPFGIKPEKWFYFSSGVNNSTGPIPALVGATISGRVYVDGIEYRPAQTPLPGDKEFIFNPQTGALSFSRVLFSCTHVDVPHFGGAGGASTNVTPGCQAIALGTATLPSAVVGAAYNQSISLSGTAPVQLGLINKPAWMNLTVTSNAILITGTPTAAGNQSVQFSATNCNCFVANYNQGFNVLPSEPICNPVTISGTSLPDGLVGTAYSQTVALTGTAPFTLSNITKPSWMTVSISGFNVTLSGVPNASGAVSVSFNANNCTNNTAAYAQSFNVSDPCTPVTFQNNTIADGTIGNTYSQSIVLNGNAPFSLSNVVKPTWMTISISGSAVYLQGVPDATGNPTVSFTASNCSSSSANFSATMHVASRPTISIVSNNGTPGSTRTQVFSIGSTVTPGDIYSVVVYSHAVSVTAAIGDNPAAIATKLSNAVNATSTNQWNDHSNAPAPGTPGYPPTASASGANLTLVVNYTNQFSANAVGN